MCSTTRIIWCFTFLNLLVFVQCAPELPAEDSYGIISTESAIRNTVNNLFSTLKLKVMQNRLKLKQYSRIHNFFVSITLRNHNNLKKIVKLTDVDTIDNGTQVFITQLNEVLNEDNKSDEETDSVYVTFLIEDFINRLDHLKDRHDLKNNTKNFDSNNAIIRYFNKKEFVNTTYSKEEFAKSNDSNGSLLGENEFWQPSGRRVFQGVRSDIKQYPFMASVQFFRSFQCSGSIIKSDLIITSASCLQIAWNNRFFRENPLFLSVQVGSSFYDHGGEHIPVMEIYFHPSFTPKSLRHNLAIMRLKNVLLFGKKHKKVKKIEIDRHPWPLPSNVNGIVIVGWGVKTFAGTVVTARKNKLSVATLEFYPLDECQEIYSKEFVTDRNFCAGFFSKGAGACNHDAGGPGVIGGILTGVISFGAPVCGTVDAPTVFTKLGYYTDWIEEIMEMEAPTVKQQTTLRPVNLPTFRLPPVTMKTPMKIMPLVNGKPFKKLSEPDVGRTNDEVHEFREFLKTFFKEKTEQKTLEEETEEATESSYESEVTDSPPETQEVTDYLHTTPHVTDTPDKTFKIKPILRNKPKTTTEEEIKPSSTQLKKKIERKDKNRWSTESQSQSKDSEDKTASKQPSTITGVRYTVFNEYDSSTAESPNSDEIISSLPPRVDFNKEASTSQDTEFDEAIENLIDTLNIDFESKGTSKKKYVESNPDLTDRNKDKGKERKKTRIEVKLKRNINKNEHTSDSNKRGFREYYNKNDASSEAEQDEENVSNEYKNDNKNTLNLKNFESKGSSKKKDVESNPDLTDRNKDNGKKRKKTRIEVKLKRDNNKTKHNSDSNKKGDREYYNKKDDSSEDERDEENSSKEYKNEKTLNLKDFESKGSSKKKDVESNPDLTDRNKDNGKKRKKTRIEVKLKRDNKKTKHNSDSNKKGDREYYNKKGDREYYSKKDDSSEDERDEENSSKEYKNEKTLNLKDFESKGSSKKKDVESNPDLTDRNKDNAKKRKKAIIEVKLKRDNKKNKHNSDSNKRGDREYYNKKDDSSENERDEENGSNEYKNEIKQSDNNPKPFTKAYMESHSTDTQENEDSTDTQENEEVVHTVHKNNKNKGYKTGDKDKTDEEYKTISISAESSEQENSSSNNTHRLIDMLEYEDIYKLLSGRGIED